MKAAPKDMLPPHVYRLWEKEEDTNKVLRGLGLPNIATLFPLRYRLFHAAYLDTLGRNGSPGTGLPFGDRKHSYNYVGGSNTQESNRTYGG